MSDLEDQIKKAIENDLPNQVGQALKDKLEAGDKAIRNIDYYKDKLTEVEVRLDEASDTLDKQAADIKSLKEQNDKLMADNIKLTERDRDVKVTVAEARYSMARENYENVIKLVEKFNGFDTGYKVKRVKTEHIDKDNNGFVTTTPITTETTEGPY